LFGEEIIVPKKELLFGKRNYCSGKGIIVREKESENMKLRQFSKNKVFSGEH